MTTRKLPYPARLRDQLAAELGIAGRGAVTVTPQDRKGRRCPAYDAAWYEIAAYYTDMGPPLDELEAALRARPGTVRTTQVTGNPAEIRDADWPGFGSRRDRRRLRPQVLALLADAPEDTPVPVPPRSWRQIADLLAERLSHYEPCPHRGQHPEGSTGCPFCDDAKAYAIYLAAGGRDYRGTFIPRGTPITLAELVKKYPANG